MKKKLISEFSQLININSTSKNISGIHKKGELVQSMLHNLPLKWERVSISGAADFFIARTTINNPNTPNVLLSGHIDTVFPPIPSEYEALVDGDIMRGPGCEDMLGGIMIMIESVRKLHRDKKLSNLTIALSPEEEIVTPNHRPTINSLAQNAQYVMVFEPESSKLDNYNPNVKAITRSRNGGGKYTISFSGPGGHSGEIRKKNQRHSCIISAARLVIDIEEKVSNYNKGTTLNIGMIEGGHQFNVLSPNSKLIGEFRCKSQSEYQRVITEIKQLTHDTAISPISSSFILDAGAPPLEFTRKNQRFMKIIHNVALNLGITIVEEDKTGVSEANLFMAANPELAVLDGFGACGGGEHTRKNEFAYIQSIINSSILAAETIKAVQE